jgi:hypothetical protein
VRRKNHFLPGQYGLIIRWLFCSCIFSFLQRSHEVREIERERERESIGFGTARGYLVWMLSLVLDFGEIQFDRK